MLDGKRALFLAHREELLQQAADKLFKFTGITSSLEKAEHTGVNSPDPVVVGSVQTLIHPKRLNAYAPDAFDTIIVDEAHHVLAQSYQKVLRHFAGANVLGLTATPDRADKRSLNEFFETTAFTYTLADAIRDGYLTRIVAKKMDISIDLRRAHVRNGDYDAQDIASAVEPYLTRIAERMMKECEDRKTVVFTPLIHTSKLFVDILNKHGFRAVEVNGKSKNRAEILKDFEDGKYNVIVNSMLLTEGWDCPCVDCIVMLRPTKIRALYVQAIGRGTRLYPGKRDLLLLDFLYLSDKHDLCRPADLICEDPKIADEMEKAIDDGKKIDLVQGEQDIKDAVKEREKKLAREIENASLKKQPQKAPPKPVHWMLMKECLPNEPFSVFRPTSEQLRVPLDDYLRNQLIELGIVPDTVDCMERGELLARSFSARAMMKLATPRQLSLLWKKGYNNLGHWSRYDAGQVIGALSRNNWNPPPQFNPATYDPFTNTLTDFGEGW